MNAQSRERLELFVEKAELLRSGNFYKQLQEQQGLTLNVSIRQGEEIAITHNVPQGESLQALAVTFRMFIQNNDRISIGRIEELSSDAGISQNWKDQISHVRNVINDFLDSPARVSFTNQQGIYTMREIMEVVINHRQSRWLESLNRSKRIYCDSRLMPPKEAIWSS